MLDLINLKMERCGVTDSIILNSIQCDYCGDVITSHHRHDYVSCSCGEVSCDGGRAYLKRSYNTIQGEGMLPYTELFVTSSASFEDVRNALLRGSRGVNGDQPLTWVPLSEISDDYLANLIAYQEQNMYTDSVDYKYQVMERQYRMDNNIVIEEK